MSWSLADFDYKDVRDYKIGHLTALSAVLQSEICSEGQNENGDFAKLVRLVLQGLQNVSWLREDYGQMLLQALRVAAQGESRSLDRARLVVEPLQNLDFAHTPEGISLWLETGVLIPKLKLPKNVWHHRDPLNKKDISRVGDILSRHKGSKPEQTRSESAKALTGSRQAAPHFAWETVIQSIFKKDSGSNQYTRDPDYPPKKSLFSRFWTNAIESES